MTPKQKAFCQEYLKDLNATQAAIRAGYSAKTAHVIGAENLTKPIIASYLQQETSQRAEKVQITAEMVLKQIMEDRDDAKERGQLSVSMKGNELLAKHLGMFIERHEVKDVSDVDNMTEQEIHDELDRLRKTRG